MTPWLFDPSRWLWLLCRPLMCWVVSKLEPADPKNDLGLDATQPLVYAMPKHSLTDLLVLYYHCRRLGLPRPLVSLKALRHGGQAAHYCLAEPGLIQAKKEKHPPTRMLDLLQHLRQNPAFHVQVLPVTTLWGNHPGAEERSLTRLLFSDDEQAGILQKIFIVLAQGRRNRVLLGKPIRLRELVDEGAPLDQTARKLRRLLRVHFHRQRTAVLGQKLFNRYQVIRRIINEKPVQAAIAAEAGKRSEHRQKAEAQARKYALEITADLNFSAVRFAEIVLARLWKKIFAGIEHRGLERLRTLASDYEIVYMPTHRSHLDYLLMTYTIYTNGLPMCHTAAGINLNFWPAGWFIRRWGGFFLRRSFGGNRLYAAVFNEYIHYLVTHGYPLTFFPEGGRSRTGRLLPPKTGMLSMVVQSYLRKAERQVALVPVYIGYDKVMEVGSYLRELSGGGKAKESALQLLNATKFLRGDYGKAYVSFGEPLFLHEVLPPALAELPESERGAALHDCVQELAEKVAVRTNEAALVSDNCLIGMALLSTPQLALAEEDLLRLLEALRRLQQLVPYSAYVGVPEGVLHENLRRAERLQTFKRFQHSGGDVIHLPESDATVMSYYKNNILHLFALPALIARCFQHRERLSADELSAAVLAIYPFLRYEFYLPWTGDLVQSKLRDYLAAMLELGLLHAQDNDIGRPERGSTESSQLAILGNSLGVLLERFLLTAALLRAAAVDGNIDPVQMEGQWQKLVQRLLILSGLKGLEAAAKSGFSQHLKYLRQDGFVITDAIGQLQVQASAIELSVQATKLLSPDMRATLERLSIAHR